MIPASDTYPLMDYIENDIFEISGTDEFNHIALKIFKYQSYHNPIYKKYIHQLGINPDDMKNYREIPFLPIEFFKNHKIICDDSKVEVVFKSSGTSGKSRSEHHVKKLALYHKSLLTCFSGFYGNQNDLCILALLPSYLEREDSSLVYMVKKLMGHYTHPDNGFFLHELQNLKDLLVKLEMGKQKTLLIGVSFALLEFAEKYSMNLHNTVIMETGGMKGQRKEITREELHGFLKKRLGVKSVHSEYGMTELLSQAYAKEEGNFQTPSWMKVLIRDMYDPFEWLSENRSGGINIIDLANVYSCSFIETNDIGKLNPDGSFEVLGRMDSADIRGCNLLLE